MCDDFNMSTPNSILKPFDQSTYDNIMEFGYIVEKELFGGQVDWFRSIVQESYFDHFLKGLSDNSQLPPKKLLEDYTMSYRPLPICMRRLYLVNEDLCLL